MGETGRRAYRPKRALLVAVAPLLAGDQFLDMTRAEFVAAVMKATGGSASPNEVAALFDELVEEAGLLRKAY